MHTYLVSSQSCIKFQQIRVLVRCFTYFMFITIDASERHPKVCTCSSFPRSSKSIIVFIGNCAENTCCVESLGGFRIEQTGKDTCASTLLCLNNCLGEGILLAVAYLSFIDHTFHDA